MKRLAALIVALFCSFAIAEAAPQNYDTSGNSVVSLNASTFTTMVTSSSAVPVCPGGTAAAPGACNIIAITVGCIISVSGSCTGTLVSGNVGGLFDASSTSAASITSGASEIFPLGALGSGGAQTILPWGPAGYRCQLGCVFKAGSALTNGVVIFVSGSNIAAGTVAGGSGNATPPPTLSLAPSSLSFLVNGAAQSFTASQTGGTFSIFATPAPTCATVQQSGASFLVTPGSVACTTTVGVAGIGGQSTTEPIQVSATPTPPPPPTLSLNPSTTSYSIVAGATAPPIAVAESNGNTSFGATSSASSSFNGTFASGALTIHGVATTTGTQTLTIADTSGANATAAPVQLTVAVTAPVSQVTPYPIATANTIASSQERTLLTLSPIALYAGREGSGTTMTDSGPNALNGTYGSAITWDTALTTAPASANHAPTYPSLTTTDATTNYATVPVNSLLQPTLSVTLHARIKASANASSTYITTYGYQGGGPYDIQVNGSNEIGCVFRGTNAAGAGESVAVTATSTTPVVVGQPTDVLCGTNGTSGSLELNGQLVNSVTETSATTILTALNYTYSTTRGLSIGSDPGAAATYASPYSANFPGDVSEVAIFGSYIAPPASTSDFTAAACSLENAALGLAAGSACSAVPTSGSTGAGAVTIANADGSTATSANLTMGTSGVYTLAQIGNIGGFTIATAPDSTVVNAGINGTQLTLTPQGTGSTSLVIAGSGSVSLILHVSTGQTTAYKIPSRAALAYRRSKTRQVSYRKLREEI